MGLRQVPGEDPLLSLLRSRAYVRGSLPPKTRARLRSIFLPLDGQCGDLKLNCRQLCLHVLDESRAVIGTWGPMVHALSVRLAQLTCCLKVFKADPVQLGELGRNTLFVGEFACCTVWA